jgi:hypothetical protein
VIPEGLVCLDRPNPLLKYLHASRARTLAKLLSHHSPPTFFPASICKIHRKNINNDASLPNTACSNSKCSPVSKNHDHISQSLCGWLKFTTTQSFPRTPTRSSAPTTARPRKQYLFTSRPIEPISAQLT